MTQLEWRDIFGDNLASILEEKGMTQVRLSRLSEVSTSAISDYISKRSTPSLFAVINMADALGIDLNEFIYFDEQVHDY